MKRKLFFIVLILFISISLFADNFDWTKPTKRIYDGLLFASVASENPFVNVYCVRIDTGKNLKFYTTPRTDDNYIDGERETTRRTTRNFMSDFQNENRLMLVAVNNDFFSPWPPKNPIDPTNLINFAVSDGVLVSSPNNTPAFIVTKDGKCSIERVGKDRNIENIWVACGGNEYCLENGVPKGDGKDRHPRTVCGISEDNKYVYLMVIDGRRNASIGATINEEGQWLKYFGAWTGINFDGGGSSTMCYWDMSDKNNECKLLNQPNGGNWNKMSVEEEIKGFKISERNVGNNLGVYIDLK